MLEVTLSQRDRDDLNRIWADTFSKGVALTRICRVVDDVARKELILAVLESEDWNATKTARRLKVSYRLLMLDMKRLNIARPVAGKDPEA